MAYSGLADCYNVIAGFGFASPKEAYPRAKEAAQKAFPFDTARFGRLSAWRSAGKTAYKSSRHLLALSSFLLRSRFFGNPSLGIMIGRRRTDVMNETAKPKIEELGAELAFWNTWREVYRARGIDIARLYVDWSAALAQGLTSPGAREEFTELCKAGCLPQGLAALITLFRYSPPLETFWTEMVGQPNNREKATRALEGAVNRSKPSTAMS